jgi:type IV secretion system protein VirB6
MTISCVGPDPNIGVAIRLATYLDCQARALGENGFHALVGGPIQAGLLSGLVTIFIALIGYRLILGHTPDLRDGIGWVTRLGIVLALVTSWPAFQTLVYRVATDGPVEVAAVLLPAAGLPSDDLDGRIQAAYDTMRLGLETATAPLNGPADLTTQMSPQASQSGQAAAGQAPPGQTRSLGQSPLPQTASIFVISTSGMIAALRIATGFLLAVAPLAILALLFDATLGLFSGWLRALTGAVLGTLAATIVTAIDLVSIEGELAHAQRFAQGMIVDVVDPQALTTIVLFFAVVMLATVGAAARMGGAFRLTLPQGWASATPSTNQRTSARQMSHSAQVAMAPSTMPLPGIAQPRVSAVADALTASVRREHAQAAGAAEAPSRALSIAAAGARTDTMPQVQPLGVAGRRSAGRRTRSAAARDRGA